MADFIGRSPVSISKPTAYKSIKQCQNLQQRRSFSPLLIFSNALEENIPPKMKCRSFRRNVSSWHILQPHTGPSLTSKGHKMHPQSLCMVVSWGHSPCGPRELDRDRGNKDLKSIMHLIPSSRLNSRAVLVSSKLNTSGVQPRRTKGTPSRRSNSSVLALAELPLGTLQWKGFVRPTQAAFQHPWAYQVLCQDTWQDNERQQSQIAGKDLTVHKRIFFFSEHKQSLE